jgi:hypothetical protein
MTHTNGEQDRLAYMFERHTELQIRYIGKHPRELEGQELIDYLVYMTMASVKESAGEMLDETDWKPWTPGREVNRQRAKEEIIDEWHFVMNRWLALGGSSDEFFRMYLAKNQKNHSRITNGYDGRTSKCAECHTDLEELPFEKRLQVMCLMVEKDELRFCNIDHLEQWQARERAAADANG